MAAGTDKNAAVRPARRSRAAARPGEAWSRQLVKGVAAAVLLVVVFKVVGWLDGPLSKLPPLLELVLLLVVGAAALALRLAARGQPEPQPARSARVADEPVAPASPTPPPVAAPEVAAPSPGTSAPPAVDPYGELVNSMARAASALDDAASVLETVTRTCASALESIGDNRRDVVIAAKAVTERLCDSEPPAPSPYLQDDQDARDLAARAPRDPEDDRRRLRRDRPRTSSRLLRRSAADVGAA